MRFKRTFFVSAILLVLLPALSEGQITGTYRIWDPNTDFPALGDDPNQTVADALGLTAQVATDTEPLTIVTVYENTVCSGHPCGVTYWNPETDLFRCYGYSSGAMTGVDVNVSGPEMTSGDGKVFGPGDTWLIKSGSFFPGGFPGCSSFGLCSLTVQFPGSNDFRSWEAGNLLGGKVDQTTGEVWYSDLSGVVGLHNPSTDVSRRWFIGGEPHYITLDSMGRAYVTVAGLDQVVRIDPSTNAVTRWAVPAPAFQPGGSFENPDGITTDDEGMIWFTESTGNEIGRLNPGTNELCEFTKDTINRPRNIATSGTLTDGDLQVFYTEQGDGDHFFDSETDDGAVGVLTVVEADMLVDPGPHKVCAFVDPTEEEITPAVVTLVPSDHSHEPTVKTITPTEHEVIPTDGVPGSGTTLTEDEIPIPPFLRFGIPEGHFSPTGMTQVIGPGRVSGSIVGSDDHFDLTSNAIIAPPITDRDGDGVPDDDDNCPDTPNPLQEDADGDGLGDVCDNCPDNSNADQADTDNDSFGDVCDACPLDANNDLDGDAVCGDVDECPGTVLPEGVPTLSLGVNRFAQTIPDPPFETTSPPVPGKGPPKSFTMSDTRGCSCEQIIEILDLGLGHTQFGCSISAMETFIAMLQTESQRQAVEASTSLALEALLCSHDEKTP